MARRALAALALLCTSRLAAAGPNDIVLSRLATRTMDGAGAPIAVGQNLELRALGSQLGVVFAPPVLGPADTLGFSGFQLSAVGSQTSIDVTQPYWRVLAGSPDPAGTAGVAHGDGALRTIGVFVQKGLWFPLPSFELGGGAVQLLDSAAWAVQGYGKIALHEGYHDLPLPSIAVRGAISRLLNQRELDLTTIAFDAIVSHHFGVGGTWRLDPFAGYNLLAIIARSEVLDATPDVDSLAPGNEMDVGNNFVFQDQSPIYRHRIVLGAKLQYYIFHMTLEGQYALAGSSTDTRTNAGQPCQPNSTTAACDATDTAAAQTTLSLSAGFDF